MDRYRQRKRRKQRKSERGQIQTGKKTQTEEVLTWTDTDKKKDANRGSLNVDRYRQEKKTQTEEVLTWIDTDRKK